MICRETHLHMGPLRLKIGYGGRLGDVESVLKRQEKMTEKKKDEQIEKAIYKWMFESISLSFFIFFWTLNFGSFAFLHLIYFIMPPTGIHTAATYPDAQDLVNRSIASKKYHEHRQLQEKLQNAVSTNHAEDIAFAQALHGKDLKKGLWAQLKSKNQDVYGVTSDTYFNMWGKDATNDSKANEKERASRYSQLVNSYYHLATDFFEYGWGKSFHFCRFYPGEEFHSAVKRHEHFLAIKTGIEPGMKVLDVGCGVGGPARAISHLTGASIIGLNNNAYQLEKAREYAVQEDLGNKLSFVKVN